MTKLELFDMVELLQDLPVQNLPLGSKGVIVDEYDVGVYEVEFIDNEGETLALATLALDQFVVVWRSATKKWVPKTDSINETRLDEH